jgi:hypothetical protein
MRDAAIRGDAPVTTFDDREKAFENLYARDQELQFKVTARRNRLTGLWAAAKLGLEGEAATDYAKAVVAADFEEAGDADVIRKLMADLSAHGVTEADVRAQLSAAQVEARRQIIEAM